MNPIRVRATADADGELHLRGLPLKKGQTADVIVLPDDDSDELVLAALEHDPGWAWLHDAAEDIYHAEDAR